MRRRLGEIEARRAGNLKVARLLELTREAVAVTAGALRAGACRAIVVRGGAVQARKGNVGENAERIEE